MILTMQYVPRAQRWSQEERNNKRNMAENRRIEARNLYVVKLEMREKIEKEIREKACDLNEKE